MLQLVTFVEIRTPSRKLERRKRNDANSSTITKEPKNAIPLLVFIPSTIGLHVGTHKDVRLASDSETLFLMETRRPSRLVRHKMVV